MSQLFTLPRQVVISASGAPYANATATFYRAGTTTLHTVYDGPNLATAQPHSNPVQADSTGTFPAIWLDDTSPYQYSVTVLDSGGALLMSESLAGALSSSNGNVVMEAPNSGRTLTVNQTAGQADDGIQIKSETGVGNYASLNLLATAVREYRFIVDTDAGNLVLRDETGSVNRFTLNTAGTWSFRIPNNSIGIGATDGTVTQISAYIASTTAYAGTLSNHGYNLLTNNAIRFAISAAGAITVTDGENTGNLYAIGYSDIPAATSGFPAGKARETAVGVTINTSDLYAGKTFAIYNTSAAPITITEGSGVTLKLLGTASTGNRTLAAYGLAFCRARSTTEVGMSGPGVS